MSRKRIADSLPSIVLAIVAAAYVWKSYDYDPASRTLPWIAGVLALILALVDIASKRDMRPAERRNADHESEAPLSTTREAATFGWIGAFVPLVVALGFYASILLYVFCYLRLYAKKGGLASAVAAFGVVGVLYLVFEVLMGYEIFGGILAGDYL